jgi:hypothetical protein
MRVTSMIPLITVFCWAAIASSSVLRELVSCSHAVFGRCSGSRTVVAQVEKDVILPQSISTSISAASLCCAPRSKKPRISSLLFGKERDM